MSAQAESRENAGDEELVARLREHDESALRALHRRHAALVFTAASRIVDPATAQEIVQDVFMTLWRKHEQFDPARGSLRTWLCRVARNAALNVRRRRGRETSGPDDEAAELEDESLQPDEALWRAHRQSVLRAAVDALPAGEREALALAYFDELTHEQIASTLRVPLGTTKSRIRVAIRRLAPVLAAVMGATLLVLAWRWRRAEQEASLEERALTLVTSSDIVPLRLAPTPLVPQDAHANYRARPGGTLAVVTASHVPPAARGEHYVAWVRLEGTWLSLGELELRSDGSALRVAEDAALSRRVDEVVVTKESAIGVAPRGPVVLGWPAPPR